MLQADRLIVSGALTKGDRSDNSTQFQKTQLE